MDVSILVGLGSVTCACVGSMKHEMKKSMKNWTPWSEHPNRKSVRGDQRNILSSCSLYERPLVG